jgi:hypothetical protein
MADTTGTAEGGAPETVKPPKVVQERINRAMARLQQIAPKNNECLQFWRGNQYVHVNREGALIQQATTISITPGQGKPPHRVRRPHNLLIDAVAHEVSAATQRVPSYQVLPTSTDPEDISAASLAERVALYGYDAWGVRKATVKAVTYAVVTGEAFVWPYFDKTMGRHIADGVCEGNIALRVFGPNQVAWEPGVQFEDSRYHVIFQARPVHDVMSEPDHVGGQLVADAVSNDIVGSSRKTQEGTNLVMVTEYLERPSAKNPNGWRLVMANGKLIRSPEAYPCHQFGRDELALYKLSYFTDPDEDRDMGPVQHALDAMRTYNDCWNKQTEWKNIALNPQVVVKNGVIEQKLTDEPGAQYTVWGASADVVWRPVPPIPQELTTMKGEAAAEIGKIFAQNEPPPQVESGKGLVALQERDSSRRAEWFGNLADWHSKVMRHCLYLVQKHFTEDRLLQIRGEAGWERIEDFRGSMIRDQIDTRVFPESIVPRTRKAIQEQVLAFAQMFPGWLTPQAAWAAIEGGMGEKLIEDYRRDVAWMGHCIQLIKGLETGKTSPEQIPEARPFDNHDVQMDVLTSWMKSTQFASLGPGPQEAAKLLLEQHEMLKADKAMKAQMQQMQTAEQLGMQNATRPAGPDSMPSLPGGQSPPGGSPQAPS